MLFEEVKRQMKKGDNLYMAYAPPRYIEILIRDSMNVEAYYHDGYIVGEHSNKKIYAHIELKLGEKPIVKREDLADPADAPDFKVLSYCTHFFIITQAEYSIEPVSINLGYGLPEEFFGLKIRKICKK